MMEGYKQTKLGLIPQDWNVGKLGDLVLINMGQSPNSSYYNIIGKGLPLIQGNADIVNGKSIARIYTTEITKIANSNDLIFTVRAPVGEIGVVTQKSCIGRGVCAIANGSSNLNFIKHLLLFNKNNWNKLSQGSTFEAISSKDLKSYTFPLPPIEEQKAIADCLSTWDEAIEKQEQLIKSKESRHKALMQKLLSGKKRLLGFSEDWKEVKLGDFASSYNGLSGKNKDDFGSGKPFITYMNVFSNSVIDTSIFELVNVADNENQNSVKYGDILFTVSSETASEAGMVSVYLDNSPVDVYLNSFCFGVRLNTLEILNPRFASFLLRFDDFRKEVFKLSQGSTRYNISKSGVLGIKFQIPNIDEQLKITEILEGSEKEIELEKRKVDQLKEQKKTLMQKLLTGKVRLPLNNE